ncbi:flagellar biosynthesis protein FliQ [Shewanella schlegeliana]|uniref:Flagellar biosynthetic protein FliQ n=1 Tax=Shewanella schlegeliana TaxID=190308 RepID=A0ABS1T369_9GAMM|nr:MULTISPECIES: flagellar biosynthesis protein FliQ [Shewanella]MBL4915239.1 flagellar biosynthesis protein FliQ [Shewanella schlegeliana]MCG9731409.1 flagellar biosynthesis protein FliQ [Shewanella sp. Isolate13]MCL1111250.1 flagellar biosynthesis protein FliQ [Shewanella schlegeliana]GIU22871.1 flagellar export apparatus protein FliQ [Shewanella sp. MBTL60-007]GIU34034.1 flagellar export apparatus protein FliQ [Shewanella schlegeliana]
MDVNELTSMFSEAIFLVVAMVGVLVVPGLLVGLLIAVFQAATQVNEQTLSFLPRLILTLLMVVFAGEWLLQQIGDFFNRLFMNIPHIIG